MRSAQVISGRLCKTRRVRLLDGPRPLWKAKVQPPTPLTNGS